MKYLEELASEVEAGRVVFHCSQERCFVYKHQETYVFVVNGGYIHETGGFSKLLQSVRHTIDEGHGNEAYLFSSALSYPGWQVCDTSLPAGVPVGKTLFELRSEIEADMRIYPTYLLKNESETFIQKSGGAVFCFSRCDDVFYGPSDAPIYVALDAFLPMWSTEKSPSYRAEIARQEEEDRLAELKYKQEQAELDGMPPRTVEMSEREYREYQTWRGNVDNVDNFDPDDHPF